MYMDYTCQHCKANLDCVDILEYFLHVYSGDRKKAFSSAQGYGWSETNKIHFNRSVIVQNKDSQWTQCPDCKQKEPLKNNSRMPRLVTAEELLNESNQLNTTTDFPHNYNSFNGVWVYCDCPPCRNYYDPTRQESAKFLNMELSFFSEQADLPSFAFSKIAKDSYFFSAIPGFHINNQVYNFATCLQQLTNPSCTYIVHKSRDNVWNRFILSNDKSFWKRLTWKNGHNVYYEDEKNIISCHVHHEELKNLFDILKDD